MEYIKLKDICDLKNGYAFKSSDYVEKSDVLNCRMSNIRPNATFDAEYNPKYLPNDYAEKYKEYLLDDGDLIIAMTDLANDPKILGVPTIVYTNGYKMLLNQRVGKLLLLNERSIKKKYLKYALSVPQNRGYFKKFAGGGVQINIGKAEILNIDIPYCDIETQNKIVEVLDKAQSLIEKKKEQIELLDELVKSRFVEMFGNPVSNKMNWNIEKLGELGHFKNGMNYKQLDSGYNIKFLGVGDFKYGNKINSIELLQRLKLQEKPSKEYLLRNNDIVFVRSNGSKELVGRCVLIGDLGEDITYSGFCIRYRNKSEKLKPNFLINLFSNDSFKKYLKKDSRGANINNLNQQILSNLEIILPSIELQNKFSEFVTKIDEIKSKMEASLSELEDNFNSLMQRAFKGELF